MASSPLNPKSNSHGRSNSLPSRPHPLILECNEHLDSLRASKATTFSSLFLSQNIRCLQDLIESVEKLTHLPLTQDVLLHEREEKWVDEVLDGSLRLLDVCSAAKDALLHTKECTREVHSMIRRKRGGEVELAAEAKKFLTSRKVVKQAISKALASLNASSKSSDISSTTDKDHQTLAAKDALLHTKECTREVHSMIRRKRGGEVELAAEAKKFLTSRKVVKQAISKALASLNASSKSSDISSTTDKDHQTLAAKDALLHTKECTREVHSMIRRKRGGEVELAAEAKKFLTSRKVVKKAISKALASLNASSKSSNISSTTDKDHQTLSLITLLQDTEVATLSTFQTVLQFISASTEAKSNTWRSISKLIQAKRVGCSEVADENEFAQVDAALQSFVFAKTSKCEETKNLQRQLEKMESCIQDFEEGLEFLFRRLIKIRVSLLNVLNH
ncbi:hypothetical protein DEO72_LG11g3844 [Vigna unguiculata]|uniref:Uncharacterized protein n=1 Tax=Vigna unguiculata TaxID=3917 RepID=A0A4D6NWN7_VIGUN|nr:hypothetical protein DEO72_LG11g3844 [Vigna unguiculata]